ncbi:MAG: NAD(P)/FAD-dependent oxidoreductase [Frankiales bacterium]|nr:NAD(P)/FAD-dependent oxidoreductase [Frankiales bacterium]
MTRTCVVGAGSSGITALKALREAGVDAFALERTDRVGGNWVFREGSASYRSLHINTSREKMAYSDFPMPRDLPDFPHHTHIAAYFDDYVDSFGLREHIRFGTSLEKAEPRPGGGWDLALGDGTTEQVDRLVVANGHHWDARWPEPAFPGADAFPGVQVHAHSFTDNTDWVGKTVVVVGMGNSAMDIAMEASWVAEDVLLAIRTPVHVVPKYAFGKPLDTVEDPRLARLLPWRVRQALTERMLRLAVGDLTRYGLPKPAHGFLQAHATVSDTILSRLAHGRVRARPTIDRFEGSEVVFADGSRTHADVVVYCTGYRITWPFLDASVLSAPDNQVALYRRVFPVDVPDLAFIGLVQPLGAIMPIAEEQGRLVAAWVSGSYRLPPREQRQASVDADTKAVRERYVGSKRHTIQVDPDVYLHQLRKERARA